LLDRRRALCFVFFGGIDQPYDLLAEPRSAIVIEISPSNSGFRLLGMQNLPGRSRA
jgi:hypothetical protein